MKYVIAMLSLVGLCGCIALNPCQPKAGEEAWTKAQVESCEKHQEKKRERLNEIMERHEVRDH